MNNNTPPPIPDEAWSATRVDKNLSATDKLRVPPHSVEAEQSVLGGLMLVDTAWERVSDRLVENDFYRHDHKLVFRAIKALADKDRPRDVVTAGEWLETHGLLDEAGGLVYVGALAKDAPGAANIKAYADIVRERSVLRQLITIGNDIAQSAFSPGGRGTTELLQEAQQRCSEIERPHSNIGPKHLMDVWMPWLEKLDERMNSGQRLVGASTGLADLDAIIGGLERGNLYLLAGRPGMAKTTAAMNIMEALAERNETSVMFQLEMPHDQMLGRQVANQSRIDLNKIRAGELDQEEWDNILKVATRLRDKPFYIDDQPGLSLNDIRSRARRLKRQHGLDLIVIDYLQLIREKGENQTARITAISQGLKELAKELDVPVIALSQLNRELEKRPNKRPISSDLRDSGSLEQDADTIIFLFREGAYDDDFLYDDVAEFIIDKQRNGPKGTIYVHYAAAQFRFSNIEETLRRDYLLHIKTIKKGRPAKATGFDG